MTSNGLEVRGSSDNHDHFIDPHTRSVHGGVSSRETWCVVRDAFMDSFPLQSWRNGGRGLFHSMPSSPSLYSLLYPLLWFAEIYYIDLASPLILTPPTRCVSPCHPFPTTACNPPIGGRNLPQRRRRKSLRKLTTWIPSSWRTGCSQQWWRITLKETTRKGCWNWRSSSSGKHQWRRNTPRRTHMSDYYSHSLWIEVWWECDSQVPEPSKGFPTSSPSMPSRPLRSRRQPGAAPNWEALQLRFCGVWHGLAQLLVNPSHLKFYPNHVTVSRPSI